MTRLRVNRKAAQRLEAGQVWVYRGEVAAQLPDDACQTVLIADERGRLLGTALVDMKSPVPVRLFSRREQAFNEELLAGRIAAAVDWRRHIVGPESTGYRLVFSESDGLPGLIVDRFGGALAIQIGMRNYQPFLDTVISELKTCLGPDLQITCVVTEQDSQRSLSYGDPSAALSRYKLNSLEFEADLLGGPKTGAFLDQRENYLAARDWSRRLGLAGRALDLFSSSGGFALHLAGEYQQVDAVDSSAEAVCRIRRNASLNAIENVRPIESDVKQFLKGLAQARRRYECVVVDPPAFAKQTRQKEEATRAYYDLNVRALGAVASSGLYVSCSCSRAMHESDLLEVLRQAARECRRSLTLLDRRFQPADHRVDLQIPEAGYLKCLYFRVSNPL